MIYEINLGTGKLDPIKNDGKNNLPIGTVLHLNGYSEPNYVVIKNMGINSKFGSYGARYMCVDPDTLGQSCYDAYELKFLSQKKDDRIQLYITDKVWDAAQVAELWEKSEAKRLQDEEAQKQAAIRYKEKVARGRVLFEKFIPASAKALIVAERHVDESDIMTDYFHHSTAETIILAWSTHTKDIFSEMRKAAAMIPETEHLVNASTEAEHREKYSMGGGYYLKDGWTNQSGWCVRKEKKWRDEWPENFYASLADRCVFSEAKQEEKTEAPQHNDAPVIRRNEEKNGIEVVFPDKPEKSVIEKLKSLGFRWSQNQGLWWRRYDEEIMSGLQF